MRMLKNEDVGVVEKALKAIGNIGDKRAEEALLHFAVKGNNRMKFLAIRALGEMDV
jgi:HEAT repeat protein